MGIKGRLPMELRRFIRDIHAGVWAGLVLLAITTAIPLLYNHYSGNPRSGFGQVFITVCDWIVSIFVGIWRWLVDPYSLPGYTLFILFLLSAGCLLGLGLVLYEHFRDEPLVAPPPPNEAYMFGAKWRLRWSGRILMETVPYCMKCDGLLQHSHYDWLSCINCGSRAIQIPRGDINPLLFKVQEEILRRLRNNLPLK